MSGKKQKVIAESSGAISQLERLGVKGAGSSIDDPEEDDQNLYVLPENVESVKIFQSLITQWNVVAGMSDFLFFGLRYESIPPVMDLMGVKKSRRAGIFQDLRIMEAVAKTELNKRG